MVLQNNKIKSKPIIKIIGLPEFDKEGIRLSDWVNQALDNAGYDLVFIDAPPSRALADARLISEYCNRPSKYR